MADGGGRGKAPNLNRRGESGVPVALPARVWASNQKATKRTFSFLLAAAFLLTGCARHYIITLNNGTQIGATGRPKLQGNVYVFKDAYGRKSYVPLGRVTQVAPASMMHDQKSQFLPRTSK